MLQGRDISSRKLHITEGSLYMYSIYMYVYRYIDIIYIDRALPTRTRCIMRVVFALFFFLHFFLGVEGCGCARSL